MNMRADPKAVRRAVNISLDGGLVDKAKAEHLNLSAIAEQAIRQALAQAMERRFREDIAHSLAEHGEYLETYGSLADALRDLEPASDG